MYSPMLFQETWKLGDGLYEKYGFLVIQHGSDIKNSRGHNSGGVAIILSTEVRRAWVAAPQKYQFVKTSLLNLRDASMLRNLTKSYLWASMAMRQWVCGLTIAI
jgi:hypothetical protein